MLLVCALPLVALYALAIADVALNSNGRCISRP